jgi:hypothetical protein
MAPGNQSPDLPAAHANLSQFAPDASDSLSRNPSHGFPSESSGSLRLLSPSDCGIMRNGFDQRPGYQAFVVERETDYDPIEAFLFLGEFLFSPHENSRNLVLICSGPEESK